MAVRSVPQTPKILAGQGLASRLPAGGTGADIAPADMLRRLSGGLDAGRARDKTLAVRALLPG